VEAPLPLAAALELPDLPARRFALWEAAEGRSLRGSLAEESDPSPTAVLVGPAGGFAREEIDVAGAAGVPAGRAGPGSCGSRPPPSSRSGWWRANGELIDPPNLLAVRGLRKMGP
jgi:hypothetical protein